MKKTILLALLLGACSKESKPCKECPTLKPKFLDLCVNGVRVWQDMSGKRGLMVELDGFRPVRCK